MSGFENPTEAPTSDNCAYEELPPEGVLGLPIEGNEVWLALQALQRDRVRAAGILSSSKVLRK